MDTGLELVETMEAMRICAGRPNTNRFFKRVYCYLLALEYGGYYGARRLVKACESPMDFAAQVVRNPRPLLLISRFTNVVLSTLCIWICYKLAEIGRLGGSASLGALGVAFCPAIVASAKVGSVDTTLVATVLLSLFFMLRIVYRRPSAWNYLFVGAFLGLAFQVKPQGLMVVPGFLIAHIWAQAREGGWRKVAAIRPIFIVLGGFMLGFLLGNPVIVISPRAWLSDMLDLVKWYSGKMRLAPIDQATSFPVYYFLTAWSQLGPPLCILAVFGCLMGVKRREPSLLIIAVGALSFMLVMGCAKSQYLLSQHQALYSLALLCILGGAGTCEILGWIRGGRRLVWQTILVLCVLGFPACGATNIVLSYSGRSTRKQAEIWIKANIPPGSKVLMDSGSHINTFAPDIPESRQNILDAMKGLEEELAAQGRNVDRLGGKWDEHGLLHYRLRLQTLPDETYDITSTKLGRDLQPIEHYRQHGFQYIVTCSYVKATIQGRDRREYPISAGFYDALDSPDSPAHRLATFEPDMFHNGPVFSVYALAPAKSKEAGNE
ncbi:MAG: glycosyltransferase family 39 protein [Planctomycetota bacterium]